MGRRIPNQIMGCPLSNWQGRHNHSAVPTDLKEGTTSHTKKTVLMSVVVAVLAVPVSALSAVSVNGIDSAFHEVNVIAAAVFNVFEGLEPTPDSEMKMPIDTASLNGCMSKLSCGRINNILVRRVGGGVSGDTEPMGIGVANGNRFSWSSPHLNNKLVDTGPIRKGEWAHAS